MEYRRDETTILGKTFVQAFSHTKSVAEIQEKGRPSLKINSCTTRGKKSAYSPADMTENVYSMLATENVSADIAQARILNMLRQQWQHSKMTAVTSLQSRCRAEYREAFSLPSTPEKVMMC